MWSNKDKGKDVINTDKSTRNMWSNTDVGQLERCGQIQIKFN